MAKITAYPSASSFDAGDVLLKDGTNGTKTITAENVAKYMAQLPNGNIAETYAPKKTYHAGDYVIHDGRLFRALYDNTDNAWDAAHWVPDTVGGAVAEVKEAVDNDLEDLKDTVDDQEQHLEEIDVTLESVVDGAYVEDGYLYLTNGDEVVAGPLGPFSGGGGGGGGGGGNNAILTVSNTSGWLAKTIAEGAECEVSFTWSSLEDDIPTGDGMLTVKNGNVVRRSITIHQGAVTVDISEFLEVGTNKMKFSVSDVYGNTKTLNFTVNVVEFAISSSFDNTPIFVAGDTIPFTYIPSGNVEKTVYLKVDGNTIGTQVVTASGRQQTFAIPGQLHGSHMIQCYFTAEIEGNTVQSNILTYDIIVADPQSYVPIISSPFIQTTAQQFETVEIPYRVYTPDSLTSQISLYYGDTKVTDLTVDRTEQIWNYRLFEEGSVALSIKTGLIEKIFSLNVTETQIDVEAETDSLVLYLTSAGRSNSEQNPAIWQDTDHNISCTLTGFNFVSDGWLRDNDGATVLRVSGDARVTIPYKAHQYDFRSTGKTIELEFASRSVLDYDATLISCMSGGRGFKLTAQKASMNSEQSEISTQYKEDEHVRIAFVVEKRAENRLLMIYINGIISGAVQYPDDDDFSQATPVDITIGSNACVTDIYNIRVYDNDLTRYQVLENWIADSSSIEQLVDRYDHNNVYDAYGNVVIEKLPGDLPYMIITCPELPQYKGDKKTVSIVYVDPVDDSKSFTAVGAQADVQGTSSQYYPRKNYKIKFKNGFVMNGETVAKYAMTDDSIPTNTFTFKADVASSEGANNTELARLYNDTCPYQTPAQELNSDVRQGIDGYPIVIFWNDGTTTTFIGKYNFNNDKGTSEVFGFVNGDESWEVKNNTSNRVLWKDDDYSGSDWLNDFEARYPDTDPPYENNAQLAEFASWIVTTDQSAATGNALPTSVTYEGITYTNDTAAYRLAKFKAEIENYVELDSALYYYIFTELFLMVDSRAKNMFPSFMGTEIVGL